MEYFFFEYFLLNVSLSKTVRSNIFEEYFLVEYFSTFIFEKYSTQKYLTKVNFKTNFIRPKSFRLKSRILLNGNFYFEEFIVEYFWRRKIYGRIFLDINCRILFLMNILWNTWCRKLLGRIFFEAYFCRLSFVK